MKKLCFCEKLSKSWGENKKLYSNLLKTFICLFLTFAWFFNKFVYRLCFTEHQNFSSLPANIFWSIWFFNNKSSQYCLLSARMIKGDFYDPHFLTTDNFNLVNFVLINKEVSKSNAPQKNSAATDPVAELHFLLLSVIFIRVFVLVYLRFHSSFIFFTQYSLRSKSIYQYSVYT